MPSLSELPGNIDRKRLIRSLERLGFIVNTYGGNGSHHKITWPKNEKCVIIPKNLPKQSLKYVLDEIEKCSHITWDEIKENL